MKNKFPTSDKVASLISQMEPRKGYFTFDLRHMSNFSHSDIKRVKNSALHFGLIDEEAVCGRVKIYRLAEKGVEYKSQMEKMSEGNFQNYINGMDMSRSNKKVKLAQKIKKSKNEKMKEKHIKSYGLNPEVQYCLTESGKDHLDKLIEKQKIVDVSLFTKRGLKTFRKRQREALILKSLEKPMDIINLGYLLCKAGERSYYSEVARLSQEGYISISEGS